MKCFITGMQKNTLSWAWHNNNTVARLLKHYYERPMNVQRLKAMCNRRGMSISVPNETY